MKLNILKIEKSLEENRKGKKCEKCGGTEYIVKDCGFTAICIGCNTRYDNNKNYSDMNEDEKVAHLRRANIGC